MLRRTFPFIALLFAPLVCAGDLSGFWKHTDEPGWIEIRLKEGKGVVVRNDKFPERVGREILTDLQVDGSDSGVWKGQVYAEKLGEYKDAEVTLPEPDLMRIKVKVGFMSRTVEWVRVDSDPVVAAESGS